MNQQVKIFNRLFQQLFLFLFLFSISLSGFGQLGKYEFTGSSSADNQFNTVTTQPVYATFSPIIRTQVKWQSGDNVFNSAEWSTTTNTNTYLEFTITAAPAYFLNLTQITFDCNRNSTGPGTIRVAHNASGNFTTNLLDVSVASNTAKAISWDFPDIRSAVDGSITFRIYGWQAANAQGTLQIDNVVLYGSVTPNLKVNEFHYANTTISKTGFVEVVAPINFKELNQITLSLYNNTGDVYGTYNLNTFKTTPSPERGQEKVYYLDIPSGLVDGIGGIALSDPTSLIYFISYGGIIDAKAGPANGTKSKLVTQTETKAGGDLNSIYLQDLVVTLSKLAGNAAADKWLKSGTNTKGYPNTKSTTAIPLEIVNFKAETSSNGVQLSWETNTEHDSKYFIIERSVDDGATFEEVGNLLAAGTSTSKLYYNFLDKRIFFFTVYYRLNQLEFDGSSNYSDILPVKSKKEDVGLILYPNPVEKDLTVFIGNTTPEKVTELLILNSSGKIIFKVGAEELSKSSELTIPLEKLASGQYFVAITANGKREVKSFIKHQPK